MKLLPEFLLIVGFVAYVIGAYLRWELPTALTHAGAIVLFVAVLTAIFRYFSGDEG